MNRDRSCLKHRAAFRPVNLIHPTAQDTTYVVSTDIGEDARDYETLRNYI
jgi:hypothetical protein